MGPRVSSGDGVVYGCSPLLNMPITPQRWSSPLHMTITSRNESLQVSHSTKFKNNVALFYSGAHVLSCFSPVQLFLTPWTVAHQAPLSVGLSRQGYQSGWPCPPPGDIPNPGIEPRPPILQADALPSEPGKLLGRKRWCRKASG